MCAAGFQQSVKAIVSARFDGVSVVKVRVVSSPRIQRIYGVELSNGRTVHLVLEPHSRLRLLKTEHSTIIDEMTTLVALRDQLRMDKGMYSVLSGHHSPAFNASISGLVPPIYDGSPSKDLLGSPWLLTEPPIGTPISSLSRPLTLPERHLVDRQLGLFAQQLAILEQPQDAKFGPVSAVFGTALASHNPTAAPRIPAASSWRVAFHSMLEGVLRDGENMAITLAYPVIRRHFHRHRYALDGVTKPKFVVVNLTDDNILVAPRSQLGDAGVLGPTGPAHMHQEQEATPYQTLPSISALMDMSHIENSDPTLGTGANGDGDKTGTGAQESPDDAGFVFSGLVDWSHCILGDPLLTSPFFHETAGPSRGFVAGLNDTRQLLRQQLGEAGVLESGRHLYGQGEGIGNVPVRMTLYEIYHAVQCIVREFYRPRADSSKKELDARKRLTDVLARLERWDEPPPPPSPSPSPSPHSSSSGGGGGGGNFRREKSELVEAHERPSADWGGGGGYYGMDGAGEKFSPPKRQKTDDMEDVRPSPDASGRPRKSPSSPSGLAGGGGGGGDRDARYFLN